jgi:hypothetical protein
MPSIYDMLAAFSFHLPSMTQPQRLPKIEAAYAAYDRPQGLCELADKLARKARMSGLYIDGPGRPGGPREVLISEAVDRACVSAIWWSLVRGEEQLKLATWNEAMAALILVSPGLTQAWVSENPDEFRLAVSI